MCILHTLVILTFLIHSSCLLLILGSFGDKFVLVFGCSKWVWLISKTSRCFLSVERIAAFSNQLTSFLSHDGDCGYNLAPGNMGPRQTFYRKTPVAPDAISPFHLLLGVFAASGWRILHCSPTVICCPSMTVAVMSCWYSRTLGRIPFQRYSKHDTCICLLPFSSLYSLRLHHFRIML